MYLSCAMGHATTAYYRCRDQDRATIGAAMSATRAQTLAICYASAEERSRWIRRLDPGTGIAACVAIPDQTTWSMGRGNKVAPDA